MLREYCELYDKKLEDLTEQEEARCVNERECIYCELYVFKEYNEEGAVLATTRPEQSHIITPAHGKKGEEKMQRAYCRWYEKELEDVTEQEQYQCDENGQDCADCPDRVFKDTTED